jgi:hypothetical protein
MRLTWRRSGRAEDRLEKWLAQRHQERVFEQGATAPGSCPEESFLRDLSAKSNRIELSDPRVDHAASCPKCMNTIVALHREIYSRRQKLILAAAGASCLVIAVALVAIARREPRKQTLEGDTTVASETVNLWDAGTLRGQQPAPLQSVSLPAKLVRLKIILPRFSEPGAYQVAVTQDQAGNDLQANSTVTAAVSDGRQEVSVELDLRKAKPGSYFLSTTHEQDQASYYYPLQIK